MINSSPRSLVDIIAVSHLPPRFAWSLARPCPPPLAFTQASASSLVLSFPSLTPPAFLLVAHHHSETVRETRLTARNSLRKLFRSHCYSHQKST
eukprot:2675239-Pleurochrysis_carterae.AAC.2